jgi:hypothetical protein
MYNIQKVVNSLNGLVGFKQPANFPFTLSESVKASSSGRFVDDNEFIKLDFINATQSNATIDEQGFNDLLTDYTRKGIISLCDQIFDEPDFVERQLLYKNANDKIATEPFPENVGFVGFQLEPESYRNNFAFEITRVILEFENTPGSLTLLLYNSAKKLPVFESDPINVTSELQEVELNWMLNDLEGLYRGEYYLGYRTDETTLQPIKRDFEDAEIRSVIKDMFIHPVYAPQANRDLFSLDDVDNVTETWGLNPDITAYKDFTDQIIQNKNLLANVLQQSIQVVILESYMTTTRSNRDQRISDDMLKKVLVELNGISTQSYNSQGLKNALSSEITRLKQEIRKTQDGYFNKNFAQVVTRS